MRILAIESSCDETAAAVVTDERHVESNVVSSQIDVHRTTGGVVPEVAARLQLETVIPVVAQALEEAGTNWERIDAIAVTAGPGLIGSLIVGAETAKTLALAKDKPLIPVNHLAGHLYACFQDEAFGRGAMGSTLATDPNPEQNPKSDEFRFPYLGLVVSGGHTELVLMTGHHRFELIGSTRDDAAGEAFDKVGKLLDLPYPGGPEISKLAKHGDPTAIDFPRPMLNQDNLDFSFSGLKTDVRREVAAKRLTAKRKADIAASFETAVVDTLVGKTIRAAVEAKLDPQISAVLLGGGVAANRLLRDRLSAALQEHGIQLFITPPELATDNAAMIGLAAYWKPDDALTGRRRFSVSADPSAALALPRSGRG